MTFAEVIARKRDGRQLSSREIQLFVDGASDGSLPPEQLAAMLMAVYLRGMDTGETAALTRAMTASGETWGVSRELPHSIDKHSTGGVGDTVSLIFAPVMVALGRPVVMMAGRGLGHTQGTVDKLESIPGFGLHASRAEAVRRVEQCGAALVAQTDEIAPADKTLYALRDLTATVGCLPLIVASIMSKKLALGAAALVLDVKAGSGAFMKTTSEARVLARSLRDVALAGGIRCDALVSRMSEPLGPFLGNACEVRHAVEILQGDRSGPLLDLTLELVRRALMLDGVPEASAQKLALDAIRSGAALRAWTEIVKAHGGDPDPGLLAAAASTREVMAERSGWVTAIDGEALGWIAVDLGAGRRLRSDPVDPAAGLEMLAAVGDRVEAGQPLAKLLFGRREVDEAACMERVRQAVTLGDTPPQRDPLVVEIDDIGPRGGGL